jgi:hypothetical protein
VFAPQAPFQAPLFAGLGNTLLAQSSDSMVPDTNGFNFSGLAQPPSIQPHHAVQATHPSMLTMGGLLNFSGFGDPSSSTQQRPALTSRQNSQDQHLLQVTTGSDLISGNQGINFDSFGQNNDWFDFGS